MAPEYAPLEQAGDTSIEEFMNGNVISIWGVSRRSELGFSIFFSSNIS